LRKIFLLLGGCVFHIIALAQYNHYYGSLHSHTGFSDGNKDSLTSLVSTPAQNFNYVKNSYHTDFWGISDHNHFQAGMRSKNDYNTGIAAANTANVDGTFVTLYGMEWGVISGGGHIITYGVDSLVGWDKEADNITNDYDIYCAKNDYASYWNILNARPNSFSTFAHPANGDYGNIAGTAYNGLVDNIAYGSVIRSGSASSSTTNYTDNTPATTYEPYWKTLLAKGYRLAPTMDADNHYTNLGRHNMCRTVVLANSLTKANVIDAYKNMRFYATEDWNTKIDFAINGNVMGQQFTTAINSSITVTATDQDVTDVFSRIQIWYGVPGSGVAATMLTQNTGSSALSFTHTTTVGNNYYYYAKIAQTDGDTMWTAPIWVTRAAALPIGIENFTGSIVNKQPTLYWQIANNSNLQNFEIEKSLDGVAFTAIGTVTANAINNAYQFIDAGAWSNLQYYRVKVKETNGTSYYSKIIVIKDAQKDLELVKLYPQPVDAVLWLQVNATKEQKLVAKIYDIVTGRELQQFSKTVSVGSNNLLMNTATLSKGVYMLVFSKPNERVLEVRFVK
jgi:trimeric autotransporter adhesin